MKPLQIGLLVLVGALGGALIMKFTQRPKPVAAPVVSAAPAPVAAPVAETAPVAAPPTAPETDVAPKPVPAEVPKPVPASHPVRPAKPARPSPLVTVAQNLPPAQPEPPAPTAPLPIQQPSAPPISNDPAPAAAPAVAPAPAVKTAPPAAPEPAPSVTLRAGMTLPIRLGESLSSEHNQAGDEFTGTLDAPLTVDGFVIAERGAHVEGRVVEAQRSGHGKKAALALELTKLDTSDGQHVAIKTETMRKLGTTMATGDQVGVVAAAAGIGAVIGALAGGGKGAAIGAGAGGAAGGGGVVATRDKSVWLPTESKLSFRLSSAATVTEQLNR